MDRKWHAIVLAKAVSYQPSAISMQLLYESGKHSLNFGHIACQAIVVHSIEKMEITSKQKVIFKLAGGAHRDLEEASKLGTATSATAFRNISRDGLAGTPNLAC